MDYIDPNLFYIPDNLEEKEYRIRLQLVLREIVQALHILYQSYGVEHDERTGGSRTGV